jgi:tetratricopeptide (TPR) repeat protein
MSDDWFRNKTWNDAIAERFHEKLRRARHKGQYLRIQACTLARTHPEVALELLDQYFALPVQTDHAQAHFDRAEALLALDRVEEAIESYEAALRREAEFPGTKTQAYLELSYLAATHGIESRYDQAIALLEENKERLMFPVEHFLWHASQALILAARRDTSGAKAHAKLALDAAACDHSGFRYHPSLGLVTAEYDDLVKKLKRYRYA